MVEAASFDASLCPKGYAGIQTLYDPYRIVKVLKRAGKRGENRWKSIPFEQAVAEIVDGGDLFGEGHVDGLNAIIACRDPKIAEALQKDTADVLAKKLTLEEFKTKQAANLKYLIDPDHPDLGLKNNQFCLNWGRLKGGRSELIRRFTEFSCGSINYHGHTTVCQGSLYFSGKAMTKGARIFSGRASIIGFRQVPISLGEPALGSGLADTREEGTSTVGRRPR